MAGGASVLCSAGSRKHIHTAACSGAGPGTILRRAWAAEVDLFDEEVPASSTLAQNLALGFKTHPATGLSIAIGIIAACRREASRRETAGVAGDVKGVSKIADQAEVYIVTLLETLDGDEATSLLSSRTGYQALLRAVRIRARRVLACMEVQAYVSKLWFGPRAFALIQRSAGLRSADSWLHFYLVDLPVNLLLAVPVACWPPLDATLRRALGDGYLLCTPMFKYGLNIASPLVLALALSVRGLGALRLYEGAVAMLAFFSIALIGTLHAAFYKNEEWCASRGDDPATELGPFALLPPAADSSRPVLDSGEREHSELH